MYAKLNKWLDTKIIYSIVFLTLTAWALFAFKTMVTLIEEQENYAKIINLSGKQRMLSQKTTLFAKRYYDSNKPFIKDHLKELIKVMKKEHEYISKNLPSKETRAIYFNSSYNLDKKVKLYLSMLEDFLKTKDKTLLKDIENYSFTLLPKLNFAVNTFEIESETITHNLLKREYFILSGTILTLILEAIFIVIPAIKIAKRKEEELKELNKTLEKKVELAISENHKKEDILKQQFRLAQMGELISNIGHQWRQPLSTISSLASGVKIQKQMNMISEEQINKALDDIVKKTQYLSKTIHNLDSLNYSQSHEFEKFSIQELINSTSNIFKDSFEYKNIFIHKDLPKEEYIISGNKNSLSQVIINILCNAKDALKQENKKTIEFKLYKAKEYFIIDIKNNGEKIKEDIIHKIFDIYFTTKHQSQGTGLGLFISHEIMRNEFKGNITVENTQDGVKFSILIPI